MSNQAKTPHAHAMRPWDGEHFAGHTIREKGGTEYAYSNEGVRISRGSESLSVPIRWMFGSGVQALTPVIEQDGKWIEHRLSWYRQSGRLSLTPGHDPMSPLDLVDAVGVVQTERTATRCFGCHTTAGEPGVTCQSCHGDGAEHIAGATSNIKRDRSVQLCAGCHRSPDTVFTSTTPELEDERSIRFAPVGLMASRCFKAGKGLTCISCHNPHGESQKTSVDAVCGSCHAAKVRRGKCPRTPGCASCHMQSGSPIRELRFTDHRIRVYP